MIRYRPFRNTDPPALCEIWRSQATRRGLASSLSPLMLDRYILSKPFFDRLGLIVAEDEERPIGFAHAGMGPEIAGCGECHDGVLSMVMTLPVPEANEIACQLIEQAEQYLRERGAERCTAIGYGKLCPFYLGLYGGSALPGVLQSDRSLHDLFLKCGYEARGETIVWQRQMSTFRPPIDRKLMQVRRQFVVEPQIDPPAAGWWDACMFVGHDLTVFDIRQRSSGECVGRALFWEMEPIASSWGMHAAGIVEVSIDEAYRRQGLATFLLGEAFRQLQTQGTTLVEVQSAAEDKPPQGLFLKLGLAPVDNGTRLVKSLNP